MELEIQNGKLVIDVNELFNNLSAEDIKELGETYCWYSNTYTNLAETLKRETFGPNYNEDLYRIMKAFFTMPDEDPNYFQRKVFDTIYTAIFTILAENGKLTALNYKYQSVNSVLYKYIKTLYGDDAAFAYNSVYVDYIYKNFSDYEAGRAMAKGLDLKIIVKEWCEAMLEKFNQE